MNFTFQLILSAKVRFLVDQNIQQPCLIKIILCYLRSLSSCINV